MNRFAALSQQQLAMRDFSEDAGRDLHMYWEHLAFQLENNASSDHAAAAVTSLRRTYPVLRGFADATGIIAAGPPGPLVRVSDRREARAFLDALRADARGPLLRGLVVNAGVISEQPFLWLSVHHLVTDGISQAVITDHVRAILQGKTPAPGGADYEDFAVCQRDWWPEARASYAEYFCARLGDAEWQTGVPGRAPGVHDTAPSASWHHRVLSASPSDLRRASGALRATASSIAMTAWIDSALAHIERPVVATHTNGRARDARTAVGYFANALLIAPSFSRLDGVAERVHAVRDEILAGTGYQQAHVDTVARETLGHDDAYTMLFAVIDERRERSAVPSGSARSLVPADDATRRDLCVYVCVGDTVGIDMLYRTAAYDLPAIKRAADVFDERLTRLIMDATSSRQPSQGAP